MTLIQALAKYINDLQKDKEALTERILESKEEERVRLVGQREGIQHSLDALQRVLGL